MLLNKTKTPIKILVLDKNKNITINPVVFPEGVLERCGLQILHDTVKKSRIGETKNLLTDADRRTDTILGRLRDLF